MRLRALLALSLLLNAALAIYYFRPTPPAAPAPVQAAVLLATNSPAGKTNVIVRRQFFHWTQIESDDYAKFIDNLRSIGCPELTIRDIIIADVNQLFAQRRANEIVTADSQWWKSEPSLDTTEAAFKKAAELEAERHALLAKLLGPNWNIDITQPSERGTVSLDGPVLGSLPPETKFKLQQLALAASRRAIEYVEAQRKAGQEIDPAELARFRRDHRAELAQTLTPEQLEEYQLRHSANAEHLRGILKGFEATPDEFRAIFRAREALDNEIELNYSGADPQSQRRRQEIERMRDAAVEQALGPERAPVYRATQDPLFREAQYIAEQSGAPPEKVIPLYRVQQEGVRERDRINRDTTLTADQRATAIREVEELEEAARRRILDLPPEPP